jgi:hypothetical protein
MVLQVVIHLGGYFITEPELQVRFSSYPEPEPALNLKFRGPNLVQVNFLQISAKSQVTLRIFGLRHHKFTKVQVQVQHFLGFG